MLHTIFEKHFKDFCNLYEEQYADRYGKFHLARIMDVAEHFTEEVLLKLPHRQFVFTQDAWPSRKLAFDQAFPKALRVYFRNDRKLFADFSRLIFAMIKEFYKEAAKIEITTGMVIAYQTFGDMLRFNPTLPNFCSFMKGILMVYLILKPGVLIVVGRYF